MQSVRAQFTGLSRRTPGGLPQRTACQAARAQARSAAVCHGGEPGEDQDQSRCGQTRRQGQYRRARGQSHQPVQGRQALRTRHRRGCILVSTQAGQYRRRGRARRHLHHSHFGARHANGECGLCAQLQVAGQRGARFPLSQDHRPEGAPDSSPPGRPGALAHLPVHARLLRRVAQPVISVDTKKKELVGQFKNGGKEWRPEGDPEKVNVYDFVDKELGRANPYGVYDLSNKNTFVSVGTDHDTASFAVSTIQRWWHSMGKSTYPEAKELMIMADGGGSNGSRVRLWKLELQRFADEE